MRILVINRFGHRIGGIEVHLQNLVPALMERGHEVCFVHGEPVPPGHEPVAGPGIRAQCLSGVGASEVLSGLAAWLPDVVYAHEQVDRGILGSMVDRWPAAWFAHAYSGACISGSKCWRRPVAQPCSRRLDWGCLLHFFPHRCGGRSPWTMWKLYRSQTALRSLLLRFDRIGTHSEPMRAEWVRQGADPARVRVLPFPVRGGPGPRARDPVDIAAGPLRLLYLGRFDPLKGGELLMGALPAVVRALGRPVVLTLGGEGPEGARWERLAGQAQALVPGLTVVFAGWLGGAARMDAMASADLLVMPSVWPEPFGMTGIEAAFHGVPAVAFDVGGIRAWLEAGRSGELADGAPPRVAGLSAAIIRAVKDPQHYAALCAGARSKASTFGMGRHLDALELFLGEARERRAGLGRGGRG